MRQLVSVLAEGSLRYFVHDGDDVRQVAQLVDPGTFDVSTVIEIGVSLAALYEPASNGHAVKAAPRAPVPVVARAVPAAPAPAQAAKAPVKRPRQTWGIKREDVLRLLRDAGEAGITVHETAWELARSSDERARGSVGATLQQLAKAGHDIVSVKIPGAQKLGQSGPRLRYVLREHVSEGP